MTSNSYSISQLITRLQAIQQESGDLDVVIPNPATSTLYAVQIADVLPQAGFSFQTVPAAVLSFEPKHIYQASAEAPDDDWSRDLSAAPEGVTLRIAKRIGGEDRGQRHGETWSAFEGGSRAWELAPGAVLAWALIK